MPIQANQTPGRQLIALLWAEQHQPTRRGLILRATASLLQRGYVVREAGGLCVALTEEGRTVARQLVLEHSGEVFWQALGTPGEGEDPVPPLLLTRLGS